MHAETGYELPVRSREQIEAMYEARDRLARLDCLTRAWIWSRDDGAADVLAGFAEWPHVTVRLALRGSPSPAVSGEFDAEGSLRLLQFEARDAQRGVQSADLRSMPAVSALKAWETAARQYALQVLDDVPPDLIAFDSSSPTAALASLSRSARRAPGGRIRAAGKHEELLRAVAAEYKAAAGSRSPREVVATKLGYSAAHVSRLLAECRRPRNGQPPLLGPGRGGGRRRRKSASPSQEDCRNG